MTHIANCMRASADRASVYIPSETSNLKSPLSEGEYSPVDSPKDKDKDKDKSKKERRPSRLAFSSHTGSSRYQLWPVPDRSASPSPSLLAPITERMLALNVGRSPTSLSDTAVVSTPEQPSGFWHRSGSLSRRRKISVPELGASMATVQELGVDSPTIPGRPPLRKAASDAIFHHERSSSAPGNSWRYGPFGDAMVSCVTGPTTQEDAASGPKPLIQFKSPVYGSASTSLRPLSPILSPPTSSKPVLQVDTTSVSEVKPEVPPKSPYMERRNGSPGPKQLSALSKTSTSSPAITTPITLPSTVYVDGRRSPNNPVTPAPAQASSNTASPSTAVERGPSPVDSARPEGNAFHTRNASDTSIMDRGRPCKKGLRRQRSQTCSEANKADGSKVEKPDNWTLPKGHLAVDASQTYRVEERESLHNQALQQAEKFEVLHKKDVNSLSRELRALDERCDYLRRTYKSLREGRQKLHGRMVSYLKRSETQIFSRESLLKQEEALAELDVSIDDFLLKLEQSENRRLRVRQKLLEHVAAALILSPTRAADQAESTPPRSPIKEQMSPDGIERVESIKVFADRRALDLFSDIEQAIGKMCEAC